MQEMGSGMVLDLHCTMPRESAFELLLHPRFRNFLMPTEFLLEFFNIKFGKLVFHYIKRQAVATVQLKGGFRVKTLYFIQFLHTKIERDNKLIPFFVDYFPNQVFIQFSIYIFILSDDQIQRQYNMLHIKLNKNLIWEVINEEWNQFV